PTFGKPTMATVPRSSLPSPLFVSASVCWFILAIFVEGPLASRRWSRAWPGGSPSAACQRERTRRGLMGEPWVPPCSSCRLPLADQLLDPADDVLDVQLGRVDPDRVSRRHHPLRVALIPQSEVSGERVGADLGPFGKPPFGADLPLRVQIDLHIGARAD